MLKILHPCYCTAGAKINLQLGKFRLRKALQLTSCIALGLHVNKIIKPEI